MQKDVKLAVVDLDDTLLIGSRISWFFWRLSLVFQRMGRRMQKVNAGLLSQLDTYDKVLLLSGRDIKESDFTHNQLKKAGIDFDLICCPRKEVINRWKLSIVKQAAERSSTVWIDDIFDADASRTSLFGSDPNLTTLSPNVSSKSINVDKKSSELEWL